MHSGNTLCSDTTANVLAEVICSMELEDLHACVLCVPVHCAQSSFSGTCIQCKVQSPNKMAAMALITSLIKMIHWQTVLQCVCVCVCVRQSFQNERLCQLVTFQSLPTSACEWIISNLLATVALRSWLRLGVIYFILRYLSFEQLNFIQLVTIDRMRWFCGDSDDCLSSECFPSEKLQLK